MREYEHYLSLMYEEQVNFYSFLLLCNVMLALLVPNTRTPLLVAGRQQLGALHRGTEVWWRERIIKRRGELWWLERIILLGSILPFAGPHLHSVLQCEIHHLPNVVVP